MSISLVVLPAILALPEADSPAAGSVLVIVPPASKLADLEKVRTAIRTPRRALLVADSDRVILEGGFQMLVDRSFARAPAADVLVVVDGEPGRAEESFLLERRRTAKAILLPPGSPLAERIRDEGSGGALIFLGRSESIAALLDALGGAGGPRSAAAPASAPAVRATAAVPPPATSPEVRTVRTATPAASVFDRYFSSSQSTPTPTPR